MRLWFMNHGDPDFKKIVEIEKDCDGKELHIGDWIEVISAPSAYPHPTFLGTKFKLILEGNEIKLRNPAYPKYTPHPFWYMGKRCRKVS